MSGTTGGRGHLRHFRHNLSHQECALILTELEEIYKIQPHEWLAVKGMDGAMATLAGYEDIDEFEEAIGGSFVAFLESLPHIVVQKEDLKEDGKLVFKVLPEPDPSTWRPSRSELKITRRDQLWITFLKSPHARVEIPELEFEISASGQRHVDSIYNHIANAIWNLGNYAKANRGRIAESSVSKITDTLIVLNQMLDVDFPFTWVVHDPSSLSDFNPSNEVTGNYLDGDKEPILYSEG